MTSDSTCPKPPALLWGLWCWDEDDEEGFWMSHVDGPVDRLLAPQTYTDFDDALSAARLQEDVAENIIVALIGVSPERVS